MNQFIADVLAWYRECFQRDPSTEKDKRAHRFLEESLELYQSLGRTREEALQLVDYVYGRPAGEPWQEAGGSLTTLIVLAAAHGLNLGVCGEDELARCYQKIEVIRQKDANKPKFGALPVQS